MSFVVKIMVADDPEAPILRQFEKRDDAARFYNYLLGFAFEEDAVRHGHSVQSVSLWQSQASDPSGVIAAVQRGDATLLDSYSGDRR
jgi:hypothetical protein